MLVIEEDCFIDNWGCSVPHTALVLLLLLSRILPGDLVFFMDALQLVRNDWIS